MYNCSEINPRLMNSQTLKMISQVDGWRIQRPRRGSIYYNKNENNSPKNHNQNNTGLCMYITFNSHKTSFSVTFFSKLEIYYGGVLVV